MPATNGRIYAPVPRKPEEQETISVIQRRIVIAAGLCVMAFALIGLRLVDVGLLKGSVTGAASSAADPALTLRADLLDRNGTVLARDLPVADVYVRPHALADRHGAALELADATKVSAARLEQAFDSPHNYVLVARQVVPDVQNKIIRMGLQGLEFEPALKRYYPEGLAAVQVLGTTDPDDNGVDGLELGLDPMLQDAPPGKQVTLSLDLRVQYALAHEVEEARETFSARAGGGIVMNVNTGEILGMVSLPDAPGEPGADVTHVDPRRNRMAQDVYELGSVFKIFTFAMAVEDHTTRLDEVIPIGSGFRVGKYIIHDAEHMPAVLTARDVLAQSSNAGTAQIALRSGPSRQREFLARLGLLGRVHTELPEVAAPLVPRNWGQVETATIGFGHGISVAPLSFVTAASEIVNGGRRIVPTFLKHDGDARGEQVIKPETSATMRDLLRYVVTNGTGKNADVPGYDVGGKTGSAEKVGGRRYVAHKLLTSFCAVFPIENPRYLVFVMLDEPHGTKATYGFALAAWTSAPLAKQVIARIGPMLGMSATAVPLVAAKDST
ncbi:MAG TPA: penicillin-binding protein 2 [Rhizomicrobium sp.]|jgi:cell division protein FtsI (penicillin-binding protein 3)|nr:penicillin-binding protein 2 [Rhizomicrobium sp.]